MLSDTQQDVSIKKKTIPPDYTESGAVEISKVPMQICFPVQLLTFLLDNKALLLPSGRRLSCKRNVLVATTSRLDILPHSLTLKSDNLQISKKMAPKVILLFSGKRKSGKDYVTNNLQKILGDRCEVIKISEPIKTHWAKENNLNLNELLSDSDYKEQYRLDMIKWSEEMRNMDYGCFCKIACENAKSAPIWIVSDIRRRTDINWFKETYPNTVKTIRILADIETRKARDYHFKQGVDDGPSECDLDSYTEWDLVINNGAGKSTLEEQLGSVLRMLTNI